MYGTDEPETTQPTSSPIPPLQPLDPPCPKPPVLPTKPTPTLTPSETSAPAMTHENPNNQPSWVGLFQKKEWQKASTATSDLIGSGKVKVSYPNGANRSPRITVGDEVMEALAVLWKCFVIIKLMGRMFSFPTFEQKIKQLWSPSGGIVVSDLPNNFFLVRFGLEADIKGALSGGPWTIFGHYMMVKQWDPTFNPQSSIINTTGVWVRISGLPMIHYDRNLLYAISSTIENPLKIDNNTLNATRNRFARVCIEVDLTRPLKGEIFLNGDKLQLKYESLYLICFNCERYGHDCDHCPTTKEPTGTGDRAKPSDQNTEFASRTKPRLPMATGETPWGSWMNLHGKHSNRIASQGQRAGVEVGNRFADLQVESSEVNLGKVRKKEKGCGNGNPFLRRSVCFE
ncbi:LOW QUALITY PROTEIN: hypothetical protein V2J09_002631 [Rumex salicifolius]